MAGNPSAHMHLVRQGERKAGVEDGKEGRREEREEGREEGRRRTKKANFVHMHFFTWKTGELEEKR